MSCFCLRNGALATSDVQIGELHDLEEILINQQANTAEVDLLPGDQRDEILHQVIFKF